MPFFQEVWLLPHSRKSTWPDVSSHSVLGFYPFGFPVSKGIGRDRLGPITSGNTRFLDTQSLLYPQNQVHQAIAAMIKVWLLFSGPCQQCQLEPIEYKHKSKRLFCLFTMF